MFIEVQDTIYYTHSMLSYQSPQSAFALLACCQVISLALCTRKTEQKYKEL